MSKNLLDYDLQLFASDITGEEVSETADQTEETEAESEETIEEEAGNDEPHEQTAEENARYAAIRRRAEEEARARVAKEQDALNRQVAAMCNGITHPVTGRPITNAQEYFDALSIQQRQINEKELEDKGVDPSLINRMIETNPIVQEAQAVIETARNNEADAQLQRDIAEIGKYDPNIKGINDLVVLPNFPAMVNIVAESGGRVSVTDAYKMVNFDNFMQHTNDAARQQAINQMRGKAHLPSQPNNVATDNDEVEVPAEIMSSWKAEGKTEKQIRELYKSVASKLHLN